MNKPLIATLAFAVGAISGSVATYYFVKDKFEKESNDAINDYRTACRNRIAELEKANDPCPIEDIPEDEVPTGKVDYSSMYKGTPVDTDSTDIDPEMSRLQVSPNDIADETDSDEDSDTYNETLAFAAKAANRQQEAIDENRKPYPISVRQISEECNWYSKLTYSYFVNDDIVADEWDEALDSDDALRLVGTEFKHLFGINKEDPEEVYIRNDQNTTDYEICLDKRNYADVYNARHHHDGPVTHNIFDDYPSTDVDDESDDDSSDDQDDGINLSLSSD